MGVVLFVIFSAVCIVSFIPTSYCVPFVILPGLGGTCLGMEALRQHLRTSTHSNGYCVDAGDNDSTPLLRQVAIVCEKVKNINPLRQGYNLVGLSQGGLVARGVIELCDKGPRVKNFISIGTPHAGVSTFPPCGLRQHVLLSLLKLGIYSKFMQKNFAPSGYVKIPNRIMAYIKGATFLPKINNEIPGQRNSMYKERFSSLEKLVLIKFEQDHILVPKETAWFGYYPDGASSPILPAKETKLYIEDWIGLKTLDEAGKVRFISFPGKHLEFASGDIEEHIVPFLKDDAENIIINDLTQINDLSIIPTAIPSNIQAGWTSNDLSKCPVL